MDKLKVYQILEISENSSIEEIKTAYAKLSKKYHPEEEPEKFQELHEAYTTLVRGSRHKKRDTITLQDEKPKITQQKNNFSNLNINVEQEKIDYDFDQAVDKANETETLKNRQLIKTALIQFNALLEPKNKEKLRLFQAFFHDKKYSKIIRNDEFMESLAELLKMSSLKKCIYDYIIDFYRLRGYQENELSVEAAALYRILDQKRGMDSKKKESIIYAIPIGIVAGIQTGFKSLIRESRAIIIIILLAVFTILLIKLYYKLYENHSSFYSQLVVFTLLVLSQIIVIVTDLYDPILAISTIIICVLWMIISGIITIVKTKLKLKR